MRKEQTVLAVRVTPEFRQRVRECSASRGYVTESEFMRDLLRKALEEDTHE